MMNHIAIFTTASLPWMTGTAVNPLFRAAYLAKTGDWEVTLVIPRLSLKDQVLVYPNKITFSSPSKHAQYVRQWLEERIDFESKFSISFYPGKFDKEKRSILPIGDITECILDEEADIAVLEEPEHLTWYHHGRRWKTKFRLVVGVVHTNYLEYVKREKHGAMIAFVLKHVNIWVTHIYCHKVIRLSAATQDLPRSIVCNVHGVNPKFIEIGKVKLGQQQREVAFTKGAYYIGKMVWSKGYKELIQLLSEHQDELADLQVDLYGNGEDSNEVKEAAKKLNLEARVYPGCDHTDSLFHDYKVFLNPSTTDVLCTTTAEALAMGKIVICADHPSNEFFKQFPNCHMYNNGEVFAKATLKALEEEPIPLSDELRHMISWEAATERFVEAATERFVAAAELSHGNTAQAVSAYPKASLSTYLKKKLENSVEEASAILHQAVSGIEVARRALGAIPKSLRPDEHQCLELGWDPEQREPLLTH